MPRDEAYIINNRITDAVLDGRVQRPVSVTRDYRIETPLLDPPPGARGFSLVGDGPEFTRLLLTERAVDLGVGAERARRAAWTFTNQQNATIRSVGFDLAIGRDSREPDNPDGRVTSILRVVADTSRPGQSARLLLEDVGMELRRRALIGVELGIEGSTDVRNDWTVMNRVFIADYATAAVAIVGRQSKEHRFRDCVFNGNDVGRVSVLCMDGSFHWDGGRAGGNGDCDFYIHWMNGDSFSIACLNSEGSARMLRAGIRGGAPSPMVITAPRWASNKLHPDRRVIIWAGSGPLTILGGTIGAGAQPHLPPIIDISESPTQILTVIGTDFGQHRSADYPIVRYNPDRPRQVVLQGITRRDAEGSAVIETRWEALATAV